MQTDRSTRYHKQGVIALDDVLIDHDGKLIKDVGWFWDHAEQRHKIAHDDLFANYVCPNGKHYPLEFRRFKKREQCEATGEKFQEHGYNFIAFTEHNLLSKGHKWLELSDHRAFQKYLGRYGNKWVQQKTEVTFPL